MTGRIGLFILVLAGLALLLRGDAGSIAGLEIGEFASLAAGLALLLFIGAPLLKGYAGRLGQGVKDATVWAALALVLVALYSFRAEFAFIGKRVAGELLPPGSALNVDNGASGERVVRIRKRPNGHFAARSQVNGNNVTMMVDTGASSVVLSHADARAVGIDVDKLTYSIPVRTANGSAFAAPIRLRNVAVGPIVLNDVEAMVAKPGALNESLLGMSFLTRLRSYEFNGEFLTLRI